MTAIPKRSRKTGLEPGTLVHIGEERLREGSISVILYDQESFDEKEHLSADRLPAPHTWSGVLWVDVEGIHDTALVAAVGRAYDLHGLLLEDVCNTRQRPKMEDYCTYLFLVLKTPEPRGTFRADGSEQVSLILGPDYVISFREGDGATFRSIKERIKNKGSRLREGGADHLAYSIIDAVVDGYFAVVESVADRIEALEERVLEGTKNDAPHDIHELKREMIAIRAVLWQTREMVGNLAQAGGGSLVHPSTATYLRDVYDHVIQLTDTSEVLRDTLSGLLDIYLSSVSKRLNETMKVLAIIATIFMPLTFIAGVYGMNFMYMPELSWDAGYPLTLLLMLAVAVVMIIYFRKRKWL